MQVLARQSLEKRKAAAESPGPAFEIRRLQTFVDDSFADSSADSQPTTSLRTIAIAVTIVNPHARSYSDEIDDLFAIGASVGKTLGRKLAAQNPAFVITCCGKAAIVGRGGELEHAVGLTGAGFESAVRQSLHLERGNMPVERCFASQKRVVSVPLGPVSVTAGRHGELAFEMSLGPGPRDDEVIVVLAISGKHIG